MFFGGGSVEENYFICYWRRGFLLLEENYYDPKFISWKWSGSGEEQMFIVIYKMNGERRDDVWRARGRDIGEIL